MVLRGMQDGEVNMNDRLHNQIHDYIVDHPMAVANLPAMNAAAAAGGVPIAPEPHVGVEVAVGAHAHLHPPIVLQNASDDSDSEEEDSQFTTSIQTVNLK